MSMKSVFSKFCFGGGGCSLAVPFLGGPMLSADTKILTVFLFKGVFLRNTLLAFVNPYFFMMITQDTPLCTVIKLMGG